jgi:hypothetical protein
MNMNVRCALAFVLLISGGLRAQQPADVVRVRGTVFDSVSRTPVAGALVQFVRENGEPGVVSASSSAAGNFDVLLPRGEWIAGFTHPRLDSLMIDLPAQRVAVGQGRVAPVRLAIPSSRTLLRALCGPQTEDSAGVLQGFVLRAPEQAALDSGGVYVQWTELQISQAGLERGIPTVRARVRPDGSYRACGVPANTEAVVWAQRGAASTGLVGTTIPASGIARMDFMLDPTATREAAVLRDSMVNVDTTAPLPGELLRPLPRMGTARLRGVVLDQAGRALRTARVHLVDRRPVLADQAGSFVLDSLPQGTQTLVVRALGYAPENRIVNVWNDASPDTIRLTSIKAMLDTVRVTAQRVFDGDVYRFEQRRLVGDGRYIGREEIDRKRPYEVTNLLYGLPGVRLTFSRGHVTVFMRGMGVGGSAESGATSGWCSPAIFVDGIEQMLDFASDVNSLVQPEDLAGVAVYNSAAMTPVEFIGLGGRGCGSVVLFTRSRPTRRQ